MSQNVLFKSESKQEKELREFVKQYFPNSGKKRFYPDENNHRTFIEGWYCNWRIKIK